jgi:hypothetical protein
MKRLSKATRKFCFISKSEQSYLTDYINLSRNDLIKDFSFENLNLLGLKIYEPDIIVIDQYFTEDYNTSLISSIKLNFKKAKIYFLSPEYANHIGVIQSLNNKNHFYSNFSVDILNHINALLGDNSSNDYLEAS